MLSGTGGSNIFFFFLAFCLKPYVLEEKKKIRITILIFNVYTIMIIEYKVNLRWTDIINKKTSIEKFNEPPLCVHEQCAADQCGTELLYL